MSTDVWKEFEENQLTHSAAHYLMTIRDLLEERGYARVTDVAKGLNITRGSCSISLKALKRRGFVLEDENKFLSLSEEGVKLADMVQHNDQLLQKLFRDVLGVDDDQAEIDACKIEHLLSLETSRALHNFIQFFEASPKQAQPFIKAFKKAKETVCSHNAENCPTCHSVCIYEGIQGV